MGCVCEFEVKKQNRFSSKTQSLGLARFIYASEDTSISRAEDSVALSAENFGRSVSLMIVVFMSGFVLLHSTGIYVVFSSKMHS